MLKTNVSTKLIKGEQMKENYSKIIGITNKMELHIHGDTRGEKWYTNIEICKILKILQDYTFEINDFTECAMLKHLTDYFNNKIEK